MGVYRLITATTGEPVTRAEAKSWLKVEHQEDDALIDSLIRAARQQAEVYTGRQFMQATYEWRSNGFPGQREGGKEYLLASRAPLQSVSSITYTDTDGSTANTLSSTAYEVGTAWTSGLADPWIPPGEVRHTEDAPWPDTDNAVDSCRIRFVAGYGASTTDVPDTVRTAMRLMLTAWYENRGTGDDMPGAAKALLNSARTGEYLY